MGLDQSGEVEDPLFDRSEQSPLQGFKDARCCAPRREVEGWRCRTRERQMDSRAPPRAAARAQRDEIKMVLISAYLHGPSPL